MIYTIGYAGTDVDRFIKVLKEKSIDILVDVRSLAKSKYFYLFNDTNLSKYLSNNGIVYENWKQEFGARQDNPAFYSDGILDYEKFAKSEQFTRGIEKIVKLNQENKNVCLMCAEIDPVNCHRAVLCAREIAMKDIKIEHIILKRNDETIFEPHGEFEKRLLSLTKESILDNAYKKQGKKIAYKLAQ